MRDKYARIYDEFLRCCEHDEEVEQWRSKGISVIDWRVSGPTTILLYLSDGSRYEYDDSMARVYSVPDKFNDDDELTDERWKELFTTKIRKTMRVKHFTQSDMQQLTGIPQTTLSNYLSGKTMPPIDKLRLIARALGVSVNELIEFNYYGKV